MSVILRKQTTIGYPNHLREMAGVILSDQQIILGTTPPVSGILLEKLKLQNNTGLGSTTVQGTALNTQAAARTILSVANTYLVNKLTADEMALILNNRDKFTFTIGVGDRRADFISRFVLATNWHGEDVTNFQLRPNPAGAPEYDFRLGFIGSTGEITVVDNHVGSHSVYGSIRYFTIRQK
ncbi:hypothetical protein AXA88_25390 [Salmonella enterica]|nr:hypothetical protein [Salmonella enterica]EAX3609182.1 hypothetical protein [Salmonella enterica]EGW6282803.1 hypothetical protein [Salmonella enterica]EGX3931693.1 hypothetical protein [Salmonella enterica]